MRNISIKLVTCTSYYNTPYSLSTKLKRSNHDLVLMINVTLLIDNIQSAYKSWEDFADLTVCDFFVWGFVKDNVYVPPLPKTLPELRERINTAIRNVTQDML